MPTTTLTIGKLAKQANVSVETIRYYQQIGLFEEPNKPLQGFRTYSEQNIQELKFIRKAQKLGFTLTEIQELLEIGSGQCHDIQSKAMQKRHQIEQQIKELNVLKITLDELINSCQKENHNNCCPIVENLSKI